MSPSDDESAVTGFSTACESAEDIDDIEALGSLEGMEVILTTATANGLAQTSNKEREKDIRKKLAQPTAWKCTCRQQLHTEKCLLYPRTFGEVRWRGKNVGVTAAELRFFEDRQKKQ